MAVNPLLLTMIALLHAHSGALPGHRIKLYEEVCNVLLSRRNLSKGINIDLSIDQKFYLLQLLAFKLMINGKREFNIKFAKRILSTTLSKIPQHKIKTDVFIDLIIKESSIIVEKENKIFEFAHKSFLEFFCSLYILNNNLENELLKKVNQSWWAETIRLYSSKVKQFQV